MLNWNNIDTVLLDMDGTLLDLHYDNHFWLEYVPACFAKQHGLAAAEAKTMLDQHFTNVAGTLDWYCLDYWERTLGLPIRALKEHSIDKIKYRADAQAFLQQLQNAGKQVALVTNAHPDALALKNRHTDLASRCQRQFSTHDFGYCKEFQELWQGLHKAFHFDPERTLFVDDGEHILNSARHFGIGYTLGICTPDSTQAPKSFFEHPSIDQFAELPVIA